MKFSNGSMKGKQGGFSILSVILVVVAIIGVLGAWAMSGQTNTSSASTSTTDVVGSSLISDAMAIKSTFDALMVNGSAASTITFIPNTAGSSNILDPTNGIQRPVPMASAFSSTVAPSGMWVYHPTGFAGNNIGTGSDDPALFLRGVKDGVCGQINNRLHGSSAIPATIFSQGIFTLGATVSAPTSVTIAGFASIAEVEGWMSGCIGTTGGADKNVYFYILKAN